MEDFDWYHGKAFSDIFISGFCKPQARGLSHKLLATGIFSTATKSIVTLYIIKVTKMSVVIIHDLICIKSCILVVHRSSYCQGQTFFFFHLLLPPGFILD